jgi:hypothetical protein
MAKKPAKKTASKSAKPAAKKATTKKGSSMGANEGYCVKCKAKRAISNGKTVKMANGRPAMKGTCPVCGTGMFKILSPS